MTVFENYAQFYDSLYQEKDYQAETDYLERVFQKHATKPVKTILNLGCGTGSHDLLLLERGYQLTGVDFSAQMLKVAKTKLAKYQENSSLIQADIRELDLGEQFDAVISMFAVMGYMTSNKDMAAALRAFERHLKPGGIGVFDLWFGPAVLLDPPKSVSKNVEDKSGVITRKTTSVMDVIAQTVKINFQTTHRDKSGQTTSDEETHKMRFYFYQELAYFISQANLKLVAMHPFLELKGKPAVDNWNMSVILKKP